MHKKSTTTFIGFILLAAGGCLAADMSVQLTTTDGSTKFSLQNSAAAEVGSIDSLGNATFTKVTQTGAGGSFILNQSALQSGATFYTSSGTVNSFTVGTSLTLPNASIGDAALASTPASVNTANAIVKRDGSGNFSAGTITAAHQVPVAVKTSAYSMTSTDFAIFANAGTGAFTVTLPAATNKGLLVHIKKTDSSINVVTVSRAGTDTIEGAANAMLATQNSSRTLVADGTSTWYVIASN